MMKIDRVIFLCGWVVLGAVFAQAGTDGGTRPGQMLNIQSSARPRGMGNAFTAVVDDVNALFVNPGGLGLLEHVEATAMRRQILGNIDLQHVGLIVPFGQVTSANVKSFGAMGISYGSLDYGTLQGRDVTGAGAGDFIARDRLLTMGYGKFVNQQLAVGANLKLYNMSIAERRAKGSVYDVGLFFRPAQGHWTLGLSALNLGGDIQYAAVSEAAPKTVVAGIAFRPLDEKLILAVDAVNRPEEDLGVRTGLEWLMSQTFVLRTGYDLSGGATGLTMGLGLRVHQMEALFFPIRRLSIDYSFTPLGSSSDSGMIGNSHNISVTMRLGDQ